MKVIHFIPSKLANNTILLLIILLMTIVGVTNIFFTVNEQKYEQTKWDLLQAQQSSLITLSIAKELFLMDHSLPKNCFNTTGCPFWSGYPKIRVINNDGVPNLLWWKKNAYKVPTGKINSGDKRFVIIKLYDNLYKIIAFGTNLAETEGFVSYGYFKKP